MNFKQLVLMNLQALTNFPYIEKDFDAVTDYQLLCLVVDHLNEVIKNSNEQNTVIQNLYNAFVTLKDYVDNYFDNLDIQEEIDNKLDEMAASGELADIINQEIFGELNSRVTSLENEIEDVNNYPYYDMLKNGAYTDGSTPNDTIFSTAKTNGYKKFYFSQNETNNAEYYFTNYPNINDCEIITDKNVIINVPSSSGNSYTNSATLNTNIKFKFRTEDKTQVIPKNTSDMFNMLTIPTDYSIKAQSSATELSGYKLFHYKNITNPDYLFEENTPSDYYEKDDIFFNRKANTGNSYYNGLCVAIDDVRNCVETCTNGSGTNPAFVILNSTSGIGYLIRYNGSVLSIYTNQQDSISKNRLNIFTHNQGTTDSHNWNKPCKYKIKFDKTMNKVQLLFNDGILADITLPFIPDYFGFGMHGDNTSNKLTRFVRYHQENLPINGNVNILIVGDSRFAGIGQTYKIDEILKNGLLYNGINNVTIDNRAVSGYSMSQIYNLLGSLTLSNYDIIIVETGINDYNSTQNNIAYTMHDIDVVIREAGTLNIYTACMPCGWGASDAHSDDRAAKYYGIQNALLVGLAATRTNEQIILDNNCGYQSNTSNTPVMPDGVHPNDNGLIEISRNIISGLLNHYKTY